MSNIARKGDFLVFEREGVVTEFFVLSEDVDLDSCRVGSTGRKLVHHCRGIRLQDSYFYEPRGLYWINRKATLEERDRFVEWMRRKGYKFNPNTIDISLTNQ